MPPNMTLLQVEPEKELVFCKTAVHSNPNKTLKLTNISNSGVAFKVKTTAPRSYLVRPSNGTLRKGESEEVQIILQQQQQGTDNQAIHHRFLVQAVTVNSSEPVSREQWAEFSKEQVQEQRLNVVVQEEANDAPSTKSVDAAFGANAETRNMTRVSDDTPTDELKVKYDELVQYVLKLEKEKHSLQDRLEKEALARKAPSDTGYSKIHIILVALLAFFLSYAAKFAA